MFYHKRFSVVKSFTGFAVLVGLGYVCDAPTLAEGTTGTPSALAHNSSTNASANAPVNSSGSSGSPVSARVLGAVVGTVVGTPICFVRRALWNEKDAIQGIVGETDNKLAVVSAGAFWLPFGLATGFLEAPFYSFKHSMCNSQKPFSKEQFSLGDEAK